VVYIDLLQSSSGIKGFSSLPTSSSFAADELLWSERGLEVVKISPQPRYISDIDPTVTFTSRSPKSATSHFSLYMNGELIHSGTSALKPLGPLPGSDGSYLHSTTLVPGYWHRLVQMPDLSQCTIVHRVEDASIASDGTRSTLFSSMYKFRYSPPMCADLPNYYAPTTQRLGDMDPHKVPELDYASLETLTMLSLPSPGSYDSTPSPVFEKPPSLLCDLELPYLKTDWTSYASYPTAH